MTTCLKVSTAGTGFAAGLLRESYLHLSGLSRSLILFAIIVRVTCVAQDSTHLRVDVDLVQVACSATDRLGRPITDLGREDFRLFDNGELRPIEHVWREGDLPLIIGLIADISGSQSRYVERHRQTIEQFVEHILTPNDRAFLVTVAGDVRLITDLTSSARELESGVQRMDEKEPSGILLGDCSGPPRIMFPKRFPNYGCGSTALWNGVYFASLLKMKPIEGRKALIVLTDGIDLTSTHPLTDAIRAAQSADTPVYTIRYKSLAIPGFLLATNTIARIDLHRLSTETGGRTYQAPSKGPSEIFAQIEQELRSMYVLSFTVPQSERDGKVHRLEVKAKRHDVSIRARKEYVPVP